MYICSISPSYIRFIYVKCERSIIPSKPLWQDGHSSAPSLPLNIYGKNTISVTKSKSQLILVNEWNPYQSKCAGCALHVYSNDWKKRTHIHWNEAKETTTKIINVLSFWRQYVQVYVVFLVNPKHCGRIEVFCMQVSLLIIDIV